LWKQPPDGTIAARPIDPWQLFMDTTTMAPPRSLDSSRPCADLITEGLRRMGISSSPGLAAELCLYLAELLRWNRSINLVAKADQREILEKHFLDSLTLLALIDQIGPSRLLDIGSGAGFPGLVLKVARPGIQVVLAEPRDKRAAFLRHMVRTLALEGVDVYAHRVGDGSTETTFPLVTGRGVADTARFLTLCQEVTSCGSRVILMKGPRFTQELEIFEKQAARACFAIQTVQEWQLPFSGAKRLLVLAARIR